MDWIVHILVPLIVCKLVQLRRPELSDSRVALVLLGAVLPDLNAIGYLLQWAGINYGGALLPLHVPVGSLLVAAMVSPLFKKRVQSFSLLATGLASHYFLDSFLLHAGGGMTLLFPFSWAWGFQFGLVQSNSWIPSIITIVAAAILAAAIQMKNRHRAIQHPPSN